MQCEMDWYDWINKFYNFYVAAIGGIISGCGLNIDACYRNQANRSRVVLYKLWIHFSSHLIQLYINNKTECFSYNSVHVLVSYVYQNICKKS